MSSHGSSDANSDSSSVVSGGSDFSEPKGSFRFLEYKITAGKRRNSKLLFTLDEEQYYAFNSKNKNCDAYKCIDCDNRVHLRQDGMCIQKERYYVHRHQKKGNLHLKLNVLNEIKDKCADITSLINQRKQSVRDLFYSVLSNYPGVDIDFFEHERSLQLIRSAALPKNPVDSLDIANIFGRNDIMTLLGKTKEGSIFFDGVLEGNGYSACFFSSKHSIDLFETYESFGERHLMIDGTFDVVPLGGFQQLLIIYAVYLEKVSVTF